jgi:hypothetical protein
MPDMKSMGRFYVSDLRFLRTPPIIAGPMRRPSARYSFALAPWVNIAERSSKAALQFFSGSRYIRP